MNINYLTKRLLIKDIESLPMVNYEPATLKEWPTGWLIEFYVLNPDMGKLERKRLKFEKIRKRLGDVKARKYAKVYCDAINEKLENGWNPYLETKNVKSFHKLTDAIATYLKEKKLDEKNAIFREQSTTTYESFINIFLRWLEKTKREAMYVGSFTKDTGQEYLNHVYIDKGVSPRTYNNYLSFMRTLWGWLKEKGYCSENVFADIKAKPNLEKERKPIPKEWNDRIMEYFRAKNPAMEIVCGLIYNSFMRPTEICRTQISDIKFAQGGIFLPGSKTKNGKARWCLLPPHLINMIIGLGIDKYPEDYYLFSTSLKPGKNPTHRRKLDKYWDKMRTVINLPPEYKLYSYRDTGITDLKKQGHSNLFISSITGHLNSDEIETYTHAPDPKALQYIVMQSKQL
jgi:integrase